MNVLAIDTHEVVKELKAAGFSEDQAEAVTRVVRRAQDIDLSALATKTDINGLTTEFDALRKETKAEFDALRKETKAEFDSLRKETKAEIDALRKETKFDSEALRKDTKFESDALRKDLDGLRKDLKADLSDHKADLLKWIIGAVGFQTVAILGAVFALTHALRP